VSACGDPALSVDGASSASESGRWACIDRVVILHGQAVPHVAAAVMAAAEKA